MPVGRWQPWHAGHRWLIGQALKVGKKVLICVRDVPRCEQNPFTPQEVCANLERALNAFIQEGRVKIVVIPDVESLNFGRGIGYSVIKHFPPTDVASISATKLRKA